MPHALMAACLMASWLCLVPGGWIYLSRSRRRQAGRVERGEVLRAACEAVDARQPGDAPDGAVRALLAPLSDRLAQTGVGIEVGGAASAASRLGWTVGGPRGTQAILWHLVAARSAETAAPCSAHRRAWTPPSPAEAASRSGWSPRRPFAGPAARHASTRCSGTGLARPAGGSRRGSTVCQRCRRSSRSVWRRSASLPRCCTR